MEYATPTTSWVQYNVHTANPPLQSIYASHGPGNPAIPNSSATYFYNSAVAGGTHDYAHSTEPGLNPDPSRVDPSVSLTSHAIGYPGPESQSVIHYNHLQMGDTQSLPAAYGYYWDANSQNWTAAQTFPHYQANPVGYSFMLSEHSSQVLSVSANGSERIGFATPNSTGWANPKVLPHGKVLRCKRQKKKATKKIVESAFCEVCKINCNSKDILVQHKLGKKHKKKLEKLRQLLGPLPIAATASSNPVSQPIEQANIGQPATVSSNSASQLITQANIGQSDNVLSNPTSQLITQVHICEPAAVSSNPISQPAEQPNISQPANVRKKKKKKTSGTEEDLVNKRRKVIEGGAAAESVRTCTVCNVQALFHNVILVLFLSRRFTFTLAFRMSYIRKIQRKKPNLEKKTHWRCVYIRSYQLKCTLRLWKHERRQLYLPCLISDVVSQKESILLCRV